MKKYATLLLFCSLLVGHSQLAFAKEAWVSDEIKAPLRSSPTRKSKIISMLASGKKLEVLATKKGYTKVKAPNGKVGWLSNFYVLNEQSLHEKYLPLQKELEERNAMLETLNKELADKSLLISQLDPDEKNSKGLVSDSHLLQTKLIEQNRRITKLVNALEMEKQRTLDARTQYVSLAKVSQDAVDINNQNKILQEKAVQHEQEAQQLRAENQSLKGQIGKKDFIVGVLTVLAGILVGYVLSVMMPPSAGRRNSTYNNL